MRRVTILTLIILFTLGTAIMYAAQPQTDQAGRGGAGARGGGMMGGRGGAGARGGMMGGGMMGGMMGGRGGTPPAWIEPGYDDHQNMMDQLGIKTLRPGKSGSNQTGPGFDEATANEWMPTMPDALTMNDGTKVTTAAQWPKRRAEILEAFESEVYGRIPANVPKVTWEVTNTTEGSVGDVPTITKTLVGHVDNSDFNQITVNIQASFTVPANATGKVPMFLSFGGGMGFGMNLENNNQTTFYATYQPTANGNGLFSLAAAAGDAAGTRGGAGARGGMMGGMMGGRGGAGGRGGIMGGMGGGGGANSVSNQAITHGWGYGSINPGSIQADSGGNSLRQGIIGLTNKGQPRKPDDWGALRAWQWGVSRLIDYFEANPDSKVDATKVSIEGVSRYGKAALVTEAFEPRLAVALVASSGEGGAKLHRHDFGESVENLAATSEYHWMCGNWLKYAASDINGKSMDASDLPVDSHELIALCAPRPCFISYGVPNPSTGMMGDPAWVDAHGSYMAGVLATPVYELLGKKGFGDANLFKTDKEKFYSAPMPSVSTLVGGELAWRQHEGGHESGPNIPTFFEWIGAYIKSPAAPAD